MKKIVFENKIQMRRFKDVAKKCFCFILIVILVFTFNISVLGNQHQAQSNVQYDVEYQPNGNIYFR